MQPLPRGFSVLQKISLSLMSVLVLITFVGANLQAFLWQSSDWLVSTVLPAVVVDLTNEERLDNAATPLQRNSTLDAAAQLKAEHMARNEYFSHFSPEGVSPWYWFDQSGYVYAHAGENLAIHFTDSDDVVEAWMLSPAHRENIVNGIYTEIGVGTAKGGYEGYDTVYVVQLFGAPAVVPVTEVAVEIGSPVISDLVINVPEEDVLTVSKTEGVSQSDLESDNIVVANLPDSVAEVAGIERVVIDDSLAVELNDDSSLESTTNSTREKVITVKEVEIIPVEEVGAVVIESRTIATSSGLAVAEVTVFNQAYAGGTIAAVLTKPSALLQFVYMVLAGLVVSLLSVSIVTETRKFHYVQVFHSCLLLLGMGGLWFMHSLLTGGAVIV